MKLFVFLALFGVALAIPYRHQRWQPGMKANPDEVGIHYQGDIRLPLPKMDRNGLVDERYRWPGGVVHYEFDNSYTGDQIAVVENAMAEYKRLTGGCITFVPRNGETDYINFVNYSEGCWSYVGRNGGRQELNYPQWCLDNPGSVLHEMLHALGFFHEQSRFDRDDYVTIMWDNLQPGSENNFEKYPESYAGGFGEAYDLGSVMHYGGYGFSSNGELTIVTKDPAMQDVIGQREGLSDTDLRKLMTMYQCSAKQ